MTKHQTKQAVSKIVEEKISEFQPIATTGYSKAEIHAYNMGVKNVLSVLRAIEGTLSSKGKLVIEEATVNGN